MSDYSRFKISGLKAKINSPKERATSISIFVFLQVFTMTTHPGGKLAVIIYMATIMRTNIYC